MRVLASICAALLGAFVACSDSTQPKAPVLLHPPEFAEAFTSNETVPFTTVMDQPCTGEPMQWSGEIHTQDHVTVQPDGSSNSETTVNTQNTQAEGLLTGARYVAEQELSQTFQDIPPGSTFTFEFDLHMIRSGETGAVVGDDFIVHMLAHFTVNAKGVPTASNIDLRPECK